MLGRKKADRQTKSFSPISSAKGFVQDLKSSVLNFESNPLVNASFLATTLALVCAIPTFIISIVLAINNIQLASQAFSSSSSQKFLSAIDVYYGTPASVVFILLFVVAFVLLIIYKIKSPVRSGGESIGWLVKYWGVSAVIILAAAPLVLLFAENIIVIVSAILLFLILIFFISGSDNSQSKNTPTKAPQNKDKPASNDNVITVDRSWKIFKASTFSVDNQIWAYNPAFDSREDWKLCSYNDFKNKKVLIMRKGSNTPLTERDLDSIPEGFKKNHNL